MTAKGSEFNEFKSQFKPDDRGFGYIKIMVSVHTKYQALGDLGIGDLGDRACQFPYIHKNIFRLGMKCPGGPSSWWWHGWDPTSLWWRRPRCRQTKLWWKTSSRWIHDLQNPSDPTNLKKLVLNWEKEKSNLFFFRTYRLRCSAKTRMRSVKKDSRPRLSEPEEPSNYIFAQYIILFLFSFCLVTELVFEISKLNDLQLQNNSWKTKDLVQILGWETKKSWLKQPNGLVRLNNMIDD